MGKVTEINCVLSEVTILSLPWKLYKKIKNFYHEGLFQCFKLFKTTSTYIWYSNQNVVQKNYGMAGIKQEVDMSRVAVL